MFSHATENRKSAHTTADGRLGTNIRLCCSYLRPCVSRRPVLLTLQTPRSLHCTTRHGTTRPGLARHHQGSTRSGVRPPVNPQHQRGGSGGFGLVTLSLVAASFFFLGHWLDLASGGAQSPAAAAAAATQQHQHQRQQTAASFETVSKPAIPLDAATTTAAAKAVPRPISGASGEAGAGGTEL